MKITSTNYFEEIAKVDIASLPEELQKGHKFLKMTTKDGATWKAYEASENIKRVVDLFFEKLSEHLSKGKTTSKSQTSAVLPATTKRAKAGKPSLQPQSVTSNEGFTWTERIPEELRFIRRYVNLHGKTKTKDDLLRFIKALQKAIIERRVRKASPYAKQMGYIQEKLVSTYNGMTKALAMQVSEKTLQEFKSILALEKVYPAVNLIKRYINLNGQLNVKDKAQALLNAVEKAVKTHNISRQDKYGAQVIQIQDNLRAYIKNKSQKVLSIQSAELSGLNGVLGACGCQMVHGFDGVDEPSPKPSIMNSLEFCDQDFKTLGFTGKFKAFIGDPSPGFSAMIYGRPKYGKSHLASDFAGYLARGHGKVLYVAKEEGLDRTLKDKLNQPDVKHINLDVAEELPDDLGKYDFVFLDSVNKLRLSVSDLEALRNTYQDKSFIYVFQTTKAGAFRGAQEFMHDVDVVIEVPEKGHAVQNGRFNQGGEMKIFEDELKLAA